MTASLASESPFDYRSDMSSRITSDPGICGGKPCIRHVRIRVRDIMEMLAGGETVVSMLADFDFLEREDIVSTLACAAKSIDHPVFAAAAERSLSSTCDCTARWSATCGGAVTKRIGSSTLSHRQLPTLLF